jgi:uncharacterized membrane protein YdcZ (DUF606 family)
MIFSLFLPLVAGALTVLQNTINKDVSSKISLQLSLLINNAFVLLLSVVLYLALAKLPADSLPFLFRPKAGLGDFSWRFLAPGLCGFIFITIMPLAVEKAGAVRVVIGLIVAQIIVSMLWDYFAESLPLNFNRIAGAALALAGAILATR